MRKAVLRMGGKHGRKTGTDRVASGGYPKGPAGTISEARERGSADSPACPVAAAGGREHGRGSQGGGRPLPHGATVGGLVPAGRDCRSMRPSWGWTWAAGLAHSRAGSSGGRGSGQRDLHHSSRCPAVGGRPVWGHLPAQGNLRATASGRLPPQRSPTHPWQSGPGRPGRLEKRGCGAALRVAGVTSGEHLAWADEMRVGLVSVVRRGLGPVGGEGSPRGAQGREGGLFGLGIEGW